MHEFASTAGEENHATKEQPFNGTLYFLQSNQTLISLLGRVYAKTEIFKTLGIQFAFGILEEAKGAGVALKRDRG